MLKRVTIPEGFTLQQIAQRLSEDNLVEEKVFLSSARDPQWLDQLGIEGPSLEGYLFPDTYLFHRGMTVQAIQKKMVQRFKEVFDGLTARGGNQGPPQSEKNGYPGLHGGKRKRPSQRTAFGGLGFL